VIKDFKKWAYIVEENIRKDGEEVIRGNPIQQLRHVC